MAKTYMLSAEGVAPMSVAMSSPPTDMPAMLKLYHDAGFTGPVRVDHVPTMAGEDNSEPSYGSLGRLFATGYLKGALQALKIPFQ